MRVLHLSADKLYGGVETMLATLARCRDLCPQMAPLFGLCFEGRLSAELAAAGVPAEPLGDARISRYWTIWLARRRLSALLEKQRPDVVVCHEAWPHALFAEVVRERRIPLVFWAHGMHAERNWLERLAGRVSPDLVIANSRATQGTLKALFPRARSVLIRYPVVTRGPDASNGSGRPIRASLGTPDDAVVIVQACRLERWKGHELFLSALGRMVDVPDWVAWIAGGAQRPHEQAYLAALQETARHLGIADRVRFLGQRSDVPNLLAEADIHCQPNIGPEPFGIAFIEAMLAGLPLVTTAIGAAPEIVDEHSGMLVQPNDAEALAGALRHLIANPAERTRLGAGGPPRARFLCDPAQQLAELALELGALTEQKARSGRATGAQDNGPRA
ncbi:MAG: glycosyltransferase family 4 protein [Polyangiaceae bacterium]